MTEAKTAAQRLVEVLAEENAALKRLDFPAAVALVPAKEAALAALGSPVERQPPVLARRLSDLAVENQQLLERAISVQTRIVRIIARAATTAQPAARYYGHDKRPLGRTAALAVSTRA